MQAAGPAGGRRSNSAGDCGRCDVTLHGHDGGDKTDFSRLPLRSLPVSTASNWSTESGCGATRDQLSGEHYVNFAPVAVSGMAFQAVINGATR